MYIPESLCTKYVDTKDSRKTQINLDFKHSEEKNLLTYNYLTLDIPWVFTSLGVKERHSKAAPDNSLVLLLFPANELSYSQTERERCKYAMQVTKNKSKSERSSLINYNQIINYNLYYH